MPPELSTIRVLPVIDLVRLFLCCCHLPSLLLDQSGLILFLLMGQHLTCLVAKHLLQTLFVHLRTPLGWILLLAHSTGDHIILDFIFDLSHIFIHDTKNFLDDRGVSHCGILLLFLLLVFDSRSFLSHSGFTWNPLFNIFFIFFSFFADNKFFNDFRHYIGFSSLHLLSLVEVN